MGNDLDPPRAGDGGVLPRLVNSVLWANTKALDGTLSLPSHKEGIFDLRGGPVLGLTTIECTAGAITANGTDQWTAGLSFVAGELTFMGDIEIEGFPVAGSILKIRGAKLSTQTRIQLAGAKLAAEVVDFSISGGSADLNNDSIPSLIVDELLKLVERVANDNSTVHAAILSWLNAQIAHVLTTPSAEKKENDR